MNETWERCDSDAVKRRTTFDAGARTVEVSVELWREILTQLGFVKVNDGS